MEQPAYTRRISDKILWAFHQAIEQEAVGLADLLMQALEVALTREGGAGKIDQRHEFDHVLAAYNKLKAAHTVSEAASPETPAADITNP